MTGAEGAKQENGGGSGVRNAEWGGAKAKVAAKAEYRESSASSEATPLGDVAFTSPTHKSRVGRHCDQLSQVGRVPNHNVSARVFELIDAGHARTGDGDPRGRGEQHQSQPVGAERGAAGWLSPKKNQFTALQRRATVQEGGRGPQCYNCRDFGHFS